MNIRKFKFRMAGEYTGTDNTIRELFYEYLTDNGWQAYDPENYKAGFLIFLFALFNCQHMHFRMKSAECNIQVGAVSGELDAEAKEDWTLTRLDVSINGKRIAGDPNKDDLDYIVDCMRNCPASTNLKFTNGRTEISFS